MSLFPPEADPETKILVILRGTQNSGRGVKKWHREKKAANKPATVMGDIQSLSVFIQCISWKKILEIVKKHIIELALQRGKVAELFIHQFLSVTDRAAEVSVLVS